MSAETWQLIITIVLVVVIIAFIFKKLIKVAIAIGAILLLFNVGFIMSGTEVRNFFNLDSFLSADQANKAEYYLNDFDQKREEYGVIDPEKVYDGMVGVVTQGTVIVIEGIGKIDIIAFSESVAKRIVESGNENVNTEALRSEIKDQLTGIKDSDLDQIMEEINSRLDRDQIESLVTDTPSN